MKNQIKLQKPLSNYSPHQQQFVITNQMDKACKAKGVGKRHQ